MKTLMKTRLGYQGFTLLELLVGLAIIGLILPGISEVIYQIINVTSSSQNHVLAVTQVQNAGHWINNDTTMANKPVIFDNSANPANPRLTLEWNNDVYVTGGDHHFVKYYLSNNQLTRQYCDSSGNTILSSAIVAYYVTGFSFTTVNANTIMLTITATVGKASPETRNYQITDRTN